MTLELLPFTVSYDQYAYIVDKVLMRSINLERSPATDFLEHQSINVYDVYNRIRGLIGGHAHLSVSVPQNHKEQCFV
jgi:hypothetical protein